MDLSQRYRQLMARAKKETTGRSRPRRRKNRQPMLESLDSRTLMAADAFLATDIDQVPEKHVLLSSEYFGDHDHSGHDHHNHDDHHHGDDCQCCHCLMATDSITESNGRAFSGNAASSAAPNGKWSQPGGLGSAVNVTYSYAGLLDGNFSDTLTNKQLRSSVEEALGLWASYAPLNFVEVEDAGPPIFRNGFDNTTYPAAGTPDIRIGHHEIDGRNDTLAYAYFPSSNYWGVSGDVHMDSEERWTLGNGPGTDFLEVMTHELGHALGLDHVDGVDAIMNPYHAGLYNGLGTGFLFSHDIATIQSIYGSGTGSVTPIIYNDPPQVVGISDQTLPLGTSSFTVSVDATDPDGDDLTYEASAYAVDPLETEAYELRQTHGFYPSGSESYNARGYGEKYFFGSGQSWHFMLPDGAIHRWNGTISGSPQVGQLDESFHQQLTRLTMAQSPTYAPIDAHLDWSDTQLTVTATDQTPATFYVSVEVADDYVTTTETFQVSIVDSVPTISAIDDQAASISDGALTIGVDAIDADGTGLTYTAAVQQVDELAQAAYDLDQQYGFAPARTDGYNYRGQGERYFYGNGRQWFFMLPDGAVHRWTGSISGSPQVGQLDTSYHDQLSLLLNAGQPTQQSVSVDLTWNQNQLTIDWPDDFVGSFEVTVTASDGRNDVSTAFDVTVANQAPVLNSIADQNVSATAGSLVIPVTATDADGDDLQLSVTTQQSDPDALAAFELKQRHRFTRAGSDSYNYRGYSEKYFRGEGSNWFFILPDGGVYRWTGSIAGSTQVGQLHESYHQDLGTLIDATEPAVQSVDIDTTWVDDELHIDLPDGFVGSFQVDVSASDGVETATQSFAVNVSNQAPTVGSLGNLSFAANQYEITVDVSASDLDGDSLSFSATADATDGLSQLAYDLRQQHGFYPANRDSYNARGYGERYFYGRGGAWHFMLPDGGVYRWTGSISGSTLLGELDSTYHDDLTLLTRATAPTAQTLETDLTWNGSQLTILRPFNFEGSFNVTVSVTDGTETVSRDFEVYVPAFEDSTAPSNAAKTLQSMIGAIDQLMASLVK